MWLRSSVISVYKTSRGGEATACQPLLQRLIINSVKGIYSELAKKVKELVLWKLQTFWVLTGNYPMDKTPIKHKIINLNYTNTHCMADTKDRLRHRGESTCAAEEGLVPIPSPWLPPGSKASISRSACGSGTFIRTLLTAHMAASRQSAIRSAPTKPGVRCAK